MPTELTFQHNPLLRKVSFFLSLINSTQAYPSSTFTFLMFGCPNHTLLFMKNKQVIRKHSFWHSKLPSHPAVGDSFLVKCKILLSLCDFNVWHSIKCVCCVSNNCMWFIKILLRKVITCLVNCGENQLRKFHNLREFRFMGISLSLLSSWYFFCLHAKSASPHSVSPHRQSIISLVWLLDKREFSYLGVHHYLFQA